jgi:hypothetical protein
MLPSPVFSFRTIRDACDVALGQTPLRLPRLTRCSYDRHLDTVCQSSFSASQRKRQRAPPVGADNPPTR